MQAYRFFAKEFGLTAPDAESDVSRELKTVQELAAGLPQNNLTILGLARQFAAKIERPSGSPEGNSPANRRAELRHTIRYAETSVATTWALGNSKNKGLETRSYRFDFRNGLSATGVWLGAIGVPDSAPVTIVLNDQGKKASDREVSDRVNRGEKVLAVDLLFTGDAMPAKGETSDYTQMLAATGARPLGMEAAQLIAIAHWLKDAGTAKQVSVQSAGIRNQLIAQVAAALEPGTFTEILVRDGMKSLRHLLDTPVEYEAAPDLFCLDLYKQFDIDSLGSLAEATNVRMIASR